MNEYMCPVCGYQMEDPPSDYNICPSCGTEFGLQDVNSSMGELRANWLRSGPKWWSSMEPQPKDWNPLTQITRVLEAELRQRILYTSSIESVSPSAKPEMRPIPNGSATGSRDTVLAEIEYTNKAA